MTDAHEAAQRELDAAQARATRLEAELLARRDEIRRLESEIALLRAARPARAESVSIPAPAVEWDEPEGDEHLAPETFSATPRDDAPSGARIALKLYGEPAATALPPEILVREKPVDSSAVTVFAGPDDERAGRAHYRKALAAIKAKELEQSLPLLDLAIEHATTLTSRIDAVFWRGEVLYLLGRYAEAEVEFASIVSADVEHRRLPDCLLRLGQCQRRRGATREAAAVFEALRARFPGSEAAARLPREGV